MRRVVDYFLYGNIFISLCAVCFALETYLLSGSKMQFDWLLLLVFFIILFVYNAHRLLTIELLTPLEINKHINSIYINKNKLKIISLLSLIGIIVVSFMVNKNIRWTLLLLGGIIILYGGVVIAGKGKIKSIRSIGLLKIFFISTIWAVVTTLFPLINDAVNQTPSMILLSMLERFTFIFTIVLIFDVRDLDYDRKNGIKTIPVLLGQQNTKVLTYLLLGIFWMLFGFHNYAQINYFFPLFLSVTITAISILYINYKTDALIYITVVNGMMILQFLLILLFT